MTDPIEKKSISQELSRLLVGCRVNAALFSTFTFGRTFFEQDVLNLITDARTRLGRFPITVIVDRKQYRGSGHGYQVIRPHTNRLWHAKLILLMATDLETGWTQTILGLGSANLTHSGWEENEELFAFRRWPGWCVPDVLQEELLKLEWLRASDFAAWCRENRVASKSSSQGIRLLSNLSGTPLWQQLNGPNHSGGWDEAHIIAPFTDRTDFTELEPGGRIKSFFRELAETKASPKSVLHVYLAPSDFDPDVSNRVVADKSVFDWLSQQPLKLRLHVLKPACKGRFHAKLFVFKTGGQWSVAAGSANATGAAMTEKNGNIEMLHEWKNVGRRLPLGLLPPSRPVALDKLQFIKPAFEDGMIWDAVERAIYSPKHNRLNIVWKHPHGTDDTRLRVNEKRIDPANFTLTSSCDPCIECLPIRKRQKPVRPGFVPIEVPAAFEFELSCHSKLTPAEWLYLLGQSEIELDTEGINRFPSPKFPGRKLNFKGGEFDWADKVSRLDQSLASLREMICASTGRKEMAWIEKLLSGVWRSHNPAEPGISIAECAWRKWVRTAFWQLVGQYDRRRALYRNLADCHVRWRRQLPKKLKEFPIA
jgi:hypothetical protein